MTIQFDPLSIRMDQIGDVWDLALGYQDPATGLTRMVGYTISPTGQWTESTNMQDEQHLVQIASPASSDKFTRFPKVSQGDWSGGERQLIFVNPNQYYSSTQLNTSLPGHLTCNGFYSTVSIPNGVSPVANSSSQPRVVAASLRRVYFLGVNGGTYYVSTYNLLTGGVGTAAATGMGALHEVIRSSDYPVYIGALNGIWTGSGTGTTVTLTPQVTNDNEALINGCSMAMFSGPPPSVYYITGATPPNKINSATYPLPGAGAGTTQFTVGQMEDLVQALGRGPTGLIFITGSPQGVDAYVYNFDGVNANLVGRIEGDVLDVCEANGVVYILTAALSAASNPQTAPLPVIYSVTGSTLGIFDDFRSIDPNFLPLSLTAGGHIESDGIYLFLWYSGLSVKRYRLTTGAISDVGNPAAVSLSSFGRSGTPLGDGGFVETEPIVSSTTAYLNNPQDGPNFNGSMITSWYDFGTPDVDKAFKSIEFAFNTAFTANSVTVAFEVDNPNSGFSPMTVRVAQSGLGLVAFFPVGTIGKRVRFQNVVNHVDNADVQSWSVLATLARIWTGQVACRHDMPTRRGPDQQSLTAMQKLANIQNAYMLAAGKVTLWIPDPSASVDHPSIDPITGEPVVGVSQVQAVLQDYQRQTGPGVSPGYRQREDGVWDLEADVSLTLAESLG